MDEETHRAACRCGQLEAVTRGEPLRVSICHCRACQKRSGSAFAAQVRFPVENVRVKGDAKSWTRTGDAGGEVEYRFCADCGTTVAYTLSSEPQSIAIPLGLFDDPYRFRPAASVYEERMHEWVELAGGDIDHHD
ncbi:GFA family protein [Sphingomicrobium nitratireducens]|uniref:GFA family protein n=1 Tax=Sphingomicrobium nitratireducens TaxID=2964666 RepID=UPI0022406DF3|nr:GFA family protein [Sphingomicrobium nitratireducens]